MACRRFIAVFGVAALCSCVPSVVWATTDASEKDSSVRKMGVAWNIAEDRKLENTAGVYGPEGLDKYMKRYFDQLSAKMDQLSAKIDKLSSQVTALEKASSKKEAPTEYARAQII